jgi:drug/metabolite transporter (DMT)-like permease
MGDVEALSLFALGVVLALANVTVLVIRPTRAEQRLWRSLRVQRLRRWITRRRNPHQVHVGTDTLAIARTNTRWHLVLGLVLAALILHPQLRTWPMRLLRYALLIGCVAYFFGSLVQRQKIVIAANEKRR